MPATWQQGNAIVLCTAVAASLGALLTWSGTRGTSSVRDFVSHDGDTLFGSKLGLPKSHWLPEFSIHAQLLKIGEVFLLYFTAVFYKYTKHEVNNATVTQVYLQ